MTTNKDFQVAKDKSFTASLTISVAEITQEEAAIISAVAKDYEGKGFRKGKAPLDVVRNSISQEKVIEEIINSILPKKYSEIVQKNSLKPATSPVVKIKTTPLTLDKDWEIEITGAQIPDVTIDPKAFTAIKKINQDEKLDKSKKTDEVLKILLANSKAEIAPLIISNDVNRKLSELVEQTQSAGITIDAYLKNRHQTLDEYRHELTHKVQDEWVINLAISQIATEQKIQPQKTEVEAIVKENPSLAQNPDLVYYLLTQQKVIEYLISLK